MFTFSAVCLQFSKQSATSQTHFGFTNMGSKMHHFSATAIYFWQNINGTPCTRYHFAKPLWFHPCKAFRFLVIDAFSFGKTVSNNRSKKYSFHDLKVKSVFVYVLRWSTFWNSKEVILWMSSWLFYTFWKGYRVEIIIHNIYPVSKNILRNVHVHLDWWPVE